MRTITRFTLALLSCTCLSVAAKADEIQFSTLPEPAQTTIIRETHIVGPTDVVRVVPEENGVYAVTVRKNPGESVVYVNSAGQIVQPVTGTATTQTVIQTNETPTLDTFVHNLDSSRYQLIQKKEDEEIYVDKRTGEKWKVKVEREH
ncbi:MAG TPA: hypothetical protein VE860_14735 [Chthoniobacterales bacterium]|nr:hypothetical protein [Chthoniobacterales bacterium]